MSGNAARLVYVAVAVSLVVAVAVFLALSLAVDVMVVIVVLVLPCLTNGLSLAAAGQVLRAVHAGCCPCASLCGGGDDDGAGVLQMPQVLRMGTLMTLHWLLMCVCWCMTLLLGCSPLQPCLQAAGCMSQHAALMWAVTAWQLHNAPGCNCLLSTCGFTTGLDGSCQELQQGRSRLGVMMDRGCNRNSP